MATLDVLTLEEARRAVNLPNPSATSAHDTELQLFVTSLSRRVDQLCGPVVTRTVTGERHDGGVRRVWLRESPAASVTSASEWLDGTETVLSEESDATQPADGWLLDHTGPLSYVWRRRTGGDALFARGRRNVVVTYEAGRYADTASVDKLFKLAASSILRRVWKRETSAWSQSPDFFSDTAEASRERFFRAVDPMIGEFLGDELLPPAAGI